jgi:hypothetical protein
MQILVPVCIAIMFVSLYLGFKRKWIAPVIFIDVIVSLSAAGFMHAGRSGTRTCPSPCGWAFSCSSAWWMTTAWCISTYLEDIVRQKEMQSIAEIRDDPCVQAGLKRIRANLMTLSATTVFGLMPVFLGDRSRLRHHATHRPALSRWHGGERRHHVHRALPVLRHRGVEMEAQAATRSAPAVAALAKAWMQCSVFWRTRLRPFTAAPR